MGASPTIDRTRASVRGWWNGRPRSYTTPTSLAANGFSTVISERFLPRSEPHVRSAVRTGAFARTVGEQPEHELAVKVVGRDGHVARVGASRGTGTPQQVPIDAPLVRDERDAEVGAERTQCRGRLDPPLG